jgi:hypothetical protein
MIAKKVDDIAELLEMARKAVDLVAEHQDKKAGANGQVKTGELED